MPERKMLDVTTAHLRKQDRHAMEALAAAQNPEGGFPLPHVYEQEFGWYISTGIMYGDSVENGEDVLREAGFSDEFIKLIVHAHSLDCALVSFDSAGELEPGFDVFDEYTDEPTDPATFSL